MGNGAKFTGDTNLTTLEGAKGWLRTRVRDGAECPCCTQWAQVYKRSITSQMGRWLIWLVQTYEALGGAFGPEGETWVDIKKSPVRGGDYAKLRYWGLIDQRPNDNPEKRSSGLWRPTRDGVKFAFNRLQLPKHALVFNDRCLKLEGDPIGIADTLGKKFDYEELMKG